MLLRALAASVLVALPGCAAAAGGGDPAGPRAKIPIAIVTELGTIEAELDSARAPLTTNNILRYVDAGHYDDGRFFRAVRLDNQPDDTVKIEVIQLAVSREHADEAFPPVPLERTRDTGLRHVDGALSMGRWGPDTATNSFSIVLGDQISMDFGGARNPDGQGFAVFGRVTSGMELVRQIQARPTDGQRLTPPVHILRIERR